LFCIALKEHGNGQDSDSGRQDRAQKRYQHTGLAPHMVTGIGTDIYGDGAGTALRGSQAM